MPTDAALFDRLRQQVQPEIADAIDQVIAAAPDAALNRINPLAFAAKRGLGEAATIAGFLHATHLGIFEMSWDVVCGLCGGVLHTSSSLKFIERSHYNCTLCSADCETDLSGSVEISFTVAPNIRRIAAHDPDQLELWDYVRQLYWASGSALAEGTGPLIDDSVLEAVAILPGATVSCPLTLTEGLAILFDPVTHSSQILAVHGPEAPEGQSLKITIEAQRQQNQAMTARPGALTLEMENRTARRVLPILFKVGEGLKNLLSQRLPVLTAARLLTHHTFRELYRTDVLGRHQHFKIRNLTFMFTDLKGSTALYERVGDLTAFDMISVHFDTLTDIIAAESGAVIKTIGDAVMATFPTPAQSIRAALRTRHAMEMLNTRNGSHDFSIKIGLHTGPCLAVSLNDRQDYFGQTVNIASRVQSLATADIILATAEVAEDPTAKEVILASGREVRRMKSFLRGVDRQINICEIG